MIAMVENVIKKVPGGYQVDGLHLLRGNCGCGGLSGPGGSGVGDCCLTYSVVKHEGNSISFFAKAVTPNTKNNFEWGYRVKKGAYAVDVLVYDSRDPKTFKFGGHYPPPISAWLELGWEVSFQFERAMEGAGERLPEWCPSPEVCERPDQALASAPLERLTKVP
jgi:hypothetical protein